MIAKKNKKYLAAGTYNFSSGVKHMLHNERQATLEFVERVSISTKSNAEKLKLLLIKLILSKFKVEKNVEGFNGDLLMFANNGDVKIYNFDRKTLITIVAEKSRYYKLKKAYLRFEPYVNTTYIKSNDNKQIITEKIVNFTPYNEWSDINEIKFYNIYLRKLVKLVTYEVTERTETITTQQLYNNFIGEVEDNSVLEIIDKIIPKKSYRDAWPLIKQHGDLKFDNILMSKKEFYFIDWEYSANLIFFHDFMDLIFAETGLEKYLKGNFDSYLETIFNHASLEYEKDKKVYYLLVFIMESIMFSSSVHNTEPGDHLVPFYFERLKKIVDVK